MSEIKARGTRSPLATDVARFILGTLTRVIDANSQNELTIEPGIVRVLCELGAEGIESRSIIATLTRDLAKACAVPSTPLPGGSVDVRTFRTRGPVSEKPEDLARSDPRVGDVWLKFDRHMTVTYVSRLIARVEDGKGSGLDMSRTRDFPDWTVNATLISRLPC